MSPHGCTSFDYEEGRIHAANYRLLHIEYGAISISVATLKLCVHDLEKYYVE